jgi:asparagine synthase (glutamine-hydrolysing)
MCGIVGIAGRLNREQLTAAVSAMTAAVTHRGPDDEGTWVGEEFAFGMRRLSVIDLTGGRQPMWDSRTGTGIVYNGEVYNYKSVRSGLEQAGIRFQTNGDTEVVLHSLALKGSRAVHDWNGMFAIAAWNNRENKLLLIRDRMGVKPLYYYWDGSILMFASEIKAFLASSLFPRQVNQQAMWDYLTFRYVPEPETIWRNVWKLPPGHMLEWSRDSEPRIFRYWKTDVISADEHVDIGNKTKEFENLFLDSVEQRLLASDVPVGVMLSGGLDSSSIAAAAVELGHKQFHTFSVAFSEGGAYSELHYARQVAKHLGVEQHEVIVDRSDFLQMLPEAVRAADEPLADMTIVPLLAVCRLARQHVKVALSGEGSDETLAGYNLEMSRIRFGAIKRMQSLSPWLLKPLSRVCALSSNKYADKLRRAATIPWSKWNVAHKAHMTRIWSEAEKAELWPTFASRNSDVILSRMYAAAQSEHPLDQILSIYQQSWLVEDLLMKADKMSMATSLELRVPFLDYRLVEWANRQPLDAKIGRLGWRYVTKRVLRRFAQKRLPREIVDRPKQGFPVPVCRWLADGGFSLWVWEYLAGKQARLKHLFETEQIGSQLRQAATGDVPAGDRIWLLIVLETWLREFDVQVSPACYSQPVDSFSDQSADRPSELHSMIQNN